MKGHAALIKPSYCHRSEAKQSCECCADRARVGVVGRYKHGLPLPSHSGIRPKLFRRQLV